MSAQTAMKPREITGVEVAFPANVLEWMPSREEAKAGLESLKPKIRKEWLEFQHRWFYEGIPGATFTPADGIDKDLALANLSAIQGSFAPKHEHKEEAVAWLASQWFKKVKYGPAVSGNEEETG